MLIVNVNLFRAWCWEILGAKKTKLQSLYKSPAHLPCLVRSRVPPATRLEKTRIRHEKRKKKCPMVEYNLRVNPMHCSDVFVWYTQLFKLPNLNSVKAEKMFSFVPRFCPVSLQTRLLWRQSDFNVIALIVKKGIF